MAQELVTTIQTQSPERRALVEKEYDDLYGQAEADLAAVTTEEEDEEREAAVTNLNKIARLVNAANNATTLAMLVNETNRGLNDGNRFVTLMHAFSTYAVDLQGKDIDNQWLAVNAKNIAKGVVGISGQNTPISQQAEAATSLLAAVIYDACRQTPEGRLVLRNWSDNHPMIDSLRVTLSSAPTFSRFSHSTDVADSAMPLGLVHQLLDNRAVITQALPLSTNKA